MDSWRWPQRRRKAIRSCGLTARSRRGAGTPLDRDRVAGSHQDPEHRKRLAGLAADIAADRQALLQLMRVAGVPVRGHKILAGWAAEKATRLKTGANFLTRSPLRDLTELEAFYLGIQGKAAGWPALLGSAANDACWASSDSASCSTAPATSSPSSKNSASRSAPAYSASGDDRSRFFPDIGGPSTGWPVSPARSSRGRWPCNCRWDCDSGWPASRAVMPALKLGIA